MEYKEYINIKSRQGVETVDEFTTLKECKEMSREYIGRGF